MAEVLGVAGTVRVIKPSIQWVFHVLLHCQSSSRRFTEIVLDKRRLAASLSAASRMVITS
jgi:hypothetical protein